MFPTRLGTVDSPDEKKKVFERFSKAIEDLHMIRTRATERALALGT